MHFSCKCLKIYLRVKKNQLHEVKEKVKKKIERRKEVILLIETVSVFFIYFFYLE